MIELTPKLNSALATAQLEMSNPKFDAQNPHFRSNFASLKSVREAVVPTLNKNGIAVVQELVSEDGGIGCITHLLHESGEQRAFGPFVVHPTRNDPQGQASASTYARRYQLQSVACVVGEQDDDGNAASETVIPEAHAQQIFNLLDAVDLETGEGCEAFGEAWVELDNREQLAFADHIKTQYPGNISKTKEKMRQAMRLYRLANQEVA